ncbi:hypothetical protein WJX74_008081 [Apatococcus lobatus]|uniref:beta-N-acetylhexosaminidase n=1 Tax=Apatococcus lobatus TaxID=904363 RepID=A0AAW1PZG7_9CHLO
MPRSISAFVASIALGSCLVQAGPLWPLPKNQSTGTEVLYLTEDSFTFKSTGYESEILQAAFDRFSEAIFSTPSYETDRKAEIQRIEHLDGRIDALHVYVQSSDQSLNLETDESYTLIVQSPLSWITASSVYGALRGLETFGQLVDRIELPKGRSDSFSLQAPIPPTSQSADRVKESATSIQPALDHPNIQSLEKGVLADQGQIETQAAGSRGKETTPGWQHSGPQLEDGLQEASQDGRSLDQQVLSQADSSSVSKKQAMRRLAALEPEQQLAEASSAPQEAADDRDEEDGYEEDDEDLESKTMFIINATAISDEPRFRHRGLLIDTSRHYLPVAVIQEHLEAMAASKMNVLHWHIVDDQSFPMISERLPLLSVMGAFSPSHTYSREDILEVIDYARLHGIRVLPEFDTPGHTLSWGAGYPNLLTDCYDKDGNPTGIKGPMDPTQNETYGTLWRLLQEVVEIFPDAFLHLGGDEVPFDCWESNPKVRQWMKEQNVSSFAALEASFMKRVLGLTAAAGRFPIVWQDVLDNGVELDSSTIAHVWKWWFDPSKHQDVAGLLPVSVNDSSSLRPLDCSLSWGCRGEEDFDDVPGWLRELDAVTKKGHRAILSAPWYLDIGSYAGQDWKTYYQIEPASFTEDVGQQSLLVGGEAAMWGEYTDATNSISKTWPQAAAVAERLWHQKELYKRFKESLLDQKAVDLEESSALFQQAKKRVLLHLKSQQGYKQQVDPRGALTRLRQQLSEAGSSLREVKDSRTEKFRSAYNAVKSRRRAQALPEALDEAKVLGQNGFFRGLVLASVGGVCKLFLHGLSDTQITGSEHFRHALERPSDQALVTVSNHVAAADDPALTAALVPAKYLLDQKALRWTMCATDRCFTSPTMIPFFRAAKVLPVERGAGMEQMGMRKAEEVLNRGDWVHIFPEGTRTRDGRIGPARRGVARLISSCKQPPLVVPFVHSGFDKVFPGKAKLPRPGQSVRILVGEPLGFEDLRASAQQHSWSEETLQSAIAARVGRTLCELKAELDGLPVAEVMSGNFELDPLALRPLIVEEADSLQHSWTSNRWQAPLPSQSWASCLHTASSETSRNNLALQPLSCTDMASMSQPKQDGQSDPSLQRIDYIRGAWHQDIGQALWPSQKLAL